MYKDYRIVGSVTDALCFFTYYAHAPLQDKNRYHHSFHTCIIVRLSHFCTQAIHAKNVANICLYNCECMYAFETVTNIYRIQQQYIKHVLFLDGEEPRAYDLAFRQLSSRGF